MDTSSNEQRSLATGNPEPSKLKLSLKSTSGQTYEFRCPRGQIDWNDKDQLPWSMREKISTRLTKEDFNRIAKQQNERCAGKEVTTGESHRKWDCESNTKEARCGRDDRRAGRIILLPESERGSGNGDMEEDEGDEVSENDEEEHGGDLDHHLEDPSDTRKMDSAAQHHRSGINPIPRQHSNTGTRSPNL
ncbi:hypothetical protein B7494_g2790 [Chlorociboria aeruginascens]|nr:hypothetical protein B7494_g2790 [Chlorociboria aeruginascens]